MYFKFICGSCPERNRLIESKANSKSEGVSTYAILTIEGIRIAVCREPFLGRIDFAINLNKLERK